MDTEKFFNELSQIPSFTLDEWLDQQCKDEDKLRVLKKDNGFSGVLNETAGKLFIISETQRSEEKE